MPYQVPVKFIIVRGCAAHAIDEARPCRKYASLFAADAHATLSRSTQSRRPNAMATDSKNILEKRRVEEGRPITRSPMRISSANAS